DDIDILLDIAARLGYHWHYDDHEQIWDELRRLSPLHAGMSWKRLDELGGIQWPCPDEEHPGTLFLHGWLWEDPLPRPPAPFIPTEWVPPIDELSAEYPTRLTTGRRLDSFNTGEQTNRYRSPIRLGGIVDISEEDGTALGVVEGDIVRVSSRRGSVQAPVRFDDSLRPGLAFMAIHFPDELDVNQLTIDAWDPKSGTAEFKATAVRLEKVAR
ncbi:MAG: formate dehydrogenase, partial [Actinobacteria bacterium]